MTDTPAAMAESGKARQLKTVIEIQPAEAARSDTASGGPLAELELTHDARHVRRKVFELADASRMLIDLPEATMLHQGDILTLDDGAQVRILAAEEALYDIRGRDSVHLAQLAWHIGNRHLAAEIRADAIRILRDHVIKAMLEALGAQVTEIRAPFVPVRGAYAGQGAPHPHPHAAENKTETETGAA